MASSIEMDQLKELKRQGVIDAAAFAQMATELLQSQQLVQSALEQDGELEEAEHAEQDGEKDEMLVEESGAPYEQSNANVACTCACTCDFVCRSVSVVVCERAEVQRFPRVEGKFSEGNFPGNKGAVRRNKSAEIYLQLERNSGLGQVGDSPGPSCC